LRESPLHALIARNLLRCFVERLLALGELAIPHLGVKPVVLEQRRVSRHFHAGAFAPAYRPCDSGVETN